MGKITAILNENFYEYMSQRGIRSHVKERLIETYKEFTIMRNLRLNNSRLITFKEKKHLEVILRNIKRLQNEMELKD